MPDDSVHVAQPRGAQAYRLHGAGRVADIDDVTDAILVLQQHEDAGQEVPDEVLRAEADRDADHPGAGENRRQVHAQVTEADRGGDGEDRDRGGVTEDGPERVGPLMPSFGCGLVHRGRVRRRAGAGSGRGAARGVVRLG